MTVRNTGFLLDRLGQDCHPLQFLRELTHNSIQAIERTGKPGEIVWDVDWTTYEQTNVYKLCVIDTGDGMTGPEMAEHINMLSSSGTGLSITGNYGVGAKIAAATRNHAGMVYLSWKQGRGAMIHLWRCPDDGTYGLLQQKRANGEYYDYLEVDEEIKPETIGQHGTKIVLLGNSEEENSMKAPPGVPSPSRWIAKYLNTRYFRIPGNITIKAREGWEHPRSDGARNKMRTINGQEAYLNAHAASCGTVQLAGAVAHWWILKDSEDLSNEENYYASIGHMAALYQNELYELATGRSGTARLQQFGVIFGSRYVVIYIEPDAQRSLTTNTSRTTLLLNNEPLPWADWAIEFRDKMPKAIEEHIQQKAAGASTADHSQTIRERLKGILDLFKLSRYRPNPSGELLIGDDLVRGGRAAKFAPSESSGVTGDGASGRRGGTLGNVYALFEKKDGKPGEKVTPDPFPTPRWISLKDGTREPSDLEDRAAKYIWEQNLLLINADCRVFTDMVTRWERALGEARAPRQVVEEIVHTWFEQALIETVVGVQALQGSKEWSQDQLRSALSEEALTAAVMQRYHINYSIKRDLGAKLGKLQPT